MRQGDAPPDGLPASSLVATEVEEDSHAVAAEAPLVLTIVHCPDASQVGRALALSPSLRIGRAAADVVIDDARLSRTHAEVRRADDGSVRIDDASSVNGTFVDGLRVRSRELEEGSVVRVGQTLMVLARADDAPDAPAAHDDPDFIGRSAPIRALLRAVARVAPTRIPVLVLGETGTGKELVARRLHQQSGRSGPLVALNCAGIPLQLAESTLFGHRKGAFTDATEDASGTFCAAHGGTLFLDEIATMPAELQPKLLRALETGEVRPLGSTAPRTVDVRVVSATNVDLLAEARAGRFRQDLYARLAGHIVETPPLRARRSDIPLLVDHFLSALATRPTTVTAAFLEALLIRAFPMNVRELRAAVQHALLAAGDGDVLDAAALPPAPPEPPGDADGAPSRAELERALARHRGNLALVARQFGKARMQVYRWLEHHAIDPADYRS